jgi:hypothetical protein
MKHHLFRKTAIGLVMAGTALLAVNNATASPMNSIADSWHNLGANNSKATTPNGGATANHSNATGEICVFCHTPHGGDNSAAVPIWNRKLNDPAVYTRYSQNGTSTFDAEEGPVGSVTIACLSCHDGAQAVDALINAPGSGNYTPITTAFGDPAYYAWAGTDRFAGSDTDGTGKLATTIVQNLGTDLSNDHPVSMQYAGGGYTGAGGTISGTSRDPDFTNTTGRTITKADGSTYSVTLMAMPAPNATVDTLFYIDRGTESSNPSSRDRKDIIFYTRNFTPQDTVNNSAGIQPFVECGSCHDPHNVENPTFLRTSNGIPSTGPLATQFPNAVNDAASGLCLTCHAK